MTKEKFINFRIILLFAIISMIASLSATYFFYSKKLIISIIIALLILFLFAFILSFIIKRNEILIFACSIIFIILPFLNLFARQTKLDNYQNYDRENIIVYGRISENYSWTSKSDLKITLDNLEFVKDDNVKKVNGKFVVYFNQNSINLKDFKIGNYVAVSTYVKLYKIEDNNKFNLSKLSQGVIGYGNGSYSGLTYFDKNEVSIKDRIKGSVFELIKDKNVPYGDVAFAMLFGDKTNLDENVKSIFQTTGIAHLLAVSGLHVSIIIYMIRLLLKKLKIKDNIQIFIFMFILGFYAYLCDFSVSVLRASLMALFLMYANIRGKAYDNLSVLSFVALILLTINPLYIYNVSFVLSFSAVYSIFLFTPQISRVLSKFVEEKFASTLAMNFAVQIGLILTTAYYFGRVNILSLVCNLVSVPIAIFAFVLMLIFIPIVAILPFMSFLMSIYGFLMDFVVKFNSLFMQIDCVLYFEEFSFVYVIFLNILSFIISDYYFVNKKTKQVAMLVFIATCMQVCLTI